MSEAPEMTGLLSETPESIKQTYVVHADDFAAAGAAAAAVKKTLRQLGFSKDTIRRTSIAMYEGEINMVIHGGGGVAGVEITEECVKITLQDQGPGIPDVDLAMREGFSTASDQVRELGFGAGMGLPNIKRNSDSLHIETEIGKGTTVTIMVCSESFENPG